MRKGFRCALNSFEDIFIGYIAGMDTFALGLIIADRIMRDGRIDQFDADRYASWQGPLGRKIVQGQVTIAELEAHALKMGDVTVGSGRQEYLESLLNTLLIG